MPPGRCGRRCRSPPRLIAAGSTARKDTPPQRLAESIRTIAAGDSLLDPSITQRLIEAHVGRREREEALRQRFDDLTEREREIVRHLTHGRSNAEIGRTMYLSEATVKTHVTRTLAKLGLRSRVQAVVLAYESGFVRPGELPAGAEL